MTTAPPSSRWNELRSLAEALRHVAPDVPDSHGMGHVFCTESYGLRNVLLAHPTLVLVLEGEKRYAPTGRESTFSCPAPALLLLPSDIPLRIENIPALDSGRYLALCISFDPSLLESTAQHGPVPSTETPAAEVCAGMEVATDDTLFATLHMTLRTTLEQAQGSALCPHLIRLQCEQLALLLTLRGFGPHLLTRRHALVGEALRLIQQQPHLPWTLDLLAEQLHCGSRTLRRRLQQEGRTLRELLRHARLHTALGLLQQQRCTVSEAAFSCGYDSPSRFSRRFQEHFGLLPSELLRSSRKGEADRGASLA